MACYGDRLLNVLFLYIIYYLSMGLKWNQVDYYCGLIGLLYRTWMTADDDGCGAVSGMNVWQGEQEHLEKTYSNAALSTTDPT
jgi:hypothetical protein